MHFLHHLQKVWILFKFGYLKKSKRLDFLRHTFAVHVLQKWVTDGNDLTAMLPMLSTYMGHKSVNATSRYLRLTAEVYPELLNTIEEKCAFVIPEVHNEKI